MTTEEKLAKVRSIIVTLRDEALPKEASLPKHVVTVHHVLHRLVKEALTILDTIQPAPSDAEKELIADAIAEGILNSSKFKDLIRAATGETK